MEPAGLVWRLRAQPPVEVEQPEAPWEEQPSEPAHQGLAAPQNVAMASWPEALWVVEVVLRANLVQL